jgi:hypothetical protein
LFCAQGQQGEWTGLESAFAKGLMMLQLAKGPGQCVVWSYLSYLKDVTGLKNAKSRRGPGARVKGFTEKCGQMPVHVHICVNMCYY